MGFEPANVAIANGLSENDREVIERNLDPLIIRSTSGDLMGMLIPLDWDDDVYHPDPEELERVSNQLSDDFKKKTRAAQELGYGWLWI